MDKPILMLLSSIALQFTGVFALMPNFLKYSNSGTYTIGSGYMKILLLHGAT